MPGSRPSSVLSLAVLQRASSDWMMPEQSTSADFTRRSLQWDLQDTTSNTAPYEIRGTVGFCSGGSSSGSAVAVASGLVPAALGTDTGGSVRHPAAMCGVTGFRPTRSTIPMDGVVGLAPSLDSVGILAASAEVCAAIFDCVSGRGEDGLVSLVDTNPLCCSYPLDGLSIGVPNQHYFDDIDNDINLAMSNALSALRNLGARTIRMEMPDMERIDALFQAVFGFEASRTCADIYGRYPDSLSRQNRERLAIGFQVTPERYRQAISVRSESKRTILGSGIRCGGRNIYADNTDSYSRNLERRSDERRGCVGQECQTDQVHTTHQLS